MGVESIERADLKHTLSTHTGNDVFLAALEQARDGDGLLSVLGRYIHFNAGFGGGVANLAGELAVRADLFRDLDEPLSIVADRSVEVAADVFYAAIDEFDDRKTSYRHTHRTLAQTTLKAAGAFFGHSPQDLNSIVSINTATANAVGTVRHGYGVNRSVDDRALMSGIGFHMGSEVLADGEFNILDGYLRASWPDLVAYLRDTTLETDGRRYGAYHWIHVHTTAEADHFAFASKAANRALRFYAGPDHASVAKAWVLEGFSDFAAVQERFMTGIRER